jgi:hypothetical protein
VPHVSQNSLYHRAQYNIPLINILSIRKYLCKGDSYDSN